MLRNYVNRGFAEKSFAPLNYSRQFVRAEIPQPKPAVMRSPIRNEKRNVTSSLRPDRDSSVDRSRDGINSQARPVREEGGEAQKTAGLAKGDRRLPKERFPQYLLKPPYVYTVQVESFQDPEIAAARMGELQNRGFDAWVAWIDLGEMGTWYRVLVGKYKDKGEAQAMASKLSQKSEFHRARQIATHKESAKGGGDDR
jgi:cell division septation protein DedD